MHLCAYVDTHILPSAQLFHVSNQCHFAYMGIVFFVIIASNGSLITNPSLIRTRQALLREAAKHLDRGDLSEAGKIARRALQLPEALLRRFQEVQ